MRSNPQKFYYKSNRLQQLRGFCYAAQFGNITHAADFMGLTQSSVSLQIKALEEDLQVQLFRRNGPHIVLTGEGERLLKLALPCVDSIENISTEFSRDVKQAQKSELHIALNSTTLNFILPPIVKAYIEANTDIYITLHYAEHDEAMSLLQSGVVDFAVLPRRDHLPFPKWSDYIPVFFYRPCLITRHDHPLAGRHKLSVQEISRYELTLPDENLRVISNLYDIFSQHKVSKRLRVNFVNWETTRKYIEAGLVISISSDAIICENDVLVGTPLTHLFPPVDYGFVQKHGVIGQRAKDFIECARGFGRTV